MRTTEQIRQQQIAEIRAQYPDAVAWYSEKTESWMAAPTGATQLFQAPTAVALVQQLNEHYKQYFQTPRPVSVHPTRHRTPDGARTGAVVRSMSPQTSRTAVPSKGRHKARRSGWFRRTMIGLGLMAEAA
ncbi:hypothetical protein [Thermomonospora amylolytica]|uniref:hypothetical protein n=1 Tax=Thermomonospora amylolytica TaxID=1411117 RepID=UPI0013003430|nr:hypothetical protein [Thermomonospora amylolytica]